MDDNELLMVLAKKTGWEVIPNETGVFAVVCKDRIYDYAYSETDAWEKLARNAPPWRTSVDAALALPWPEYKNIVMEIGPAGAYAAFAADGRSYDVLSTTLARALCEVFAQWAVAQEAKEGEG